jgi:hypothetical protein
VERFSLRSGLDGDTSVRARGHARFGDQDYGIELELLHRDRGALRVGYSEYSKYFDDTGGFFEPFPVSSFDLGRDLELDIGTFFAETELTIPDWPEIRLSYEHRFKEGEKALTGWGAVTQAGRTRNIFPAFKGVDETRDTVTVQVDYDVRNVALHDRFRYERFETETARFEQERDLDDASREEVTAEESRESDSLSNAFHTEARIADSVYASLGYLYASHDGDADFDMATVPFNEPFDKNWSASSVDVERDSHLINLNLMAGPYKDVRVSGGVEAELADTRGDTQAVLTEIGFGGGVQRPGADISSDRERRGLEESLALRYRGLPGTTLYGEGTWSQQDIDLEEREIEGGSLGFERDTETDRNRATYKAGFTASPVRQVTVAAHYKRKSTDNAYDHETDTLPVGYSAFINDQEIVTDEVGARVSLQPRSWVRASLQYRLQATEIETVFDNDPLSVQSGNYDAHVYSLDVTLTPVANLFLTAVQSYRNIRGSAFDNGVDSVVSYEGDVLSSVVSATYGLGENGELSLEYAYSRTDNFEDNAASGLPLLLEDRLQRVRAGYSRKLSDTLKAGITYGFHDYEGDHNGGVNDYSAHLAGFSLSVAF